MTTIFGERVGGLKSSFTERVGSRDGSSSSADQSHALPPLQRDQYLLQNSNTDHELHTKSKHPRNAFTHQQDTVLLSIHANHPTSVSKIQSTLQSTLSYLSIRLKTRSITVCEYMNVSQNQRHSLSHPKISKAFNLSFFCIHGPLTRRLSKGTSITYISAPREYGSRLELSAPFTL